jgi:hypothetical protein
LIITSLQHSSNSAWLGCFVSIVCPLPRHWRFASALSSEHRSTELSACPPTTIRLRFFDASAAARKDFLSHYIWARVEACTAKKRVLFGPRDVDCDSAHVATNFEAPFVIGLGEGAPQKIRVLQFFYRSVKVVDAGKMKEKKRWRQILTPLSAGMTSPSVSKKSKVENLAQINSDITQLDKDHKFSKETIRKQYITYNEYTYIYRERERKRDRYRSPQSWT